MTAISICIISKNEEKNMKTFLERIITHTKGYPIEILIADTGSTDQTIDIIKSFPVHLKHFDWINDFAAARNFSLNEAENDWVLVLDCDEYIESIDMDALQFFIEHHPKDIGVLSRKSHYPLNGQDGIYTDEVERFFNRKYFHYEAIIHEQVVAKEPMKFDRVAIPLVVDHCGYNGTPEELKAKKERNNKLLFKILEKNPNDPYLYFQIGQSYNILHDDEKAAYYYGKGLEFDVDPAVEYVQMMVIGYGYALLRLGRYDEALAFQSIYDEFATTADFTTLMGLIYLRCGYPIKAMQEFLKSTSFDKSSVEGANSFIPTFNMGCINEVLGETDAAIQLYQKCGNFKPALDRLKELDSKKNI